MSQPPLAAVEINLLNNRSFTLSNHFMAFCQLHPNDTPKNQKIFHLEYFLFLAG
jgi:hypothetical protein